MATTDDFKTAVAQLQSDTALNNRYVHGATGYSTASGVYVPSLYEQAQNGLTGIKGYTNLTALQAVSGVFVGQMAKVTNDTVTTNNGEYRWNGSAWIKSLDSVREELYKNTDAAISGLTSLASVVRKSGYFINKTNGTQTATANWYASELLPVSASDVIYNKTVVTDASSACGIAFYDVNKAFLGYYNPKRSEERLFVSDKYASAAFVAFSVTAANPQCGVLRYVADFSEQIKHQYADIIEKYGTESGRYWSSVGVDTASSTHSRTNYIPVTKGLRLTVTADLGAIAYITYFDKNRKFIKSVAGISLVFNNSVLLIDDDETKYIAVNYKNGTNVWIHGVPVDRLISNFKSKKLVNFGDSISAYAWCWPTYVTKHFGFSHRNFAVAGSTVQAALDVAVPSDYSDADYIIMTHGTNDFALGAPLGTIDDAPNKAGSFYARYKWVLEQIMTNAVYARIVLVTPLYRTRPANSTQLPTNAHGKTIGDYAQAVREIAEKYHLPCLDLYAKSGFNDFNMTTLTDDGLHPTRDAQYNLLTQIYIGFLQSM